jgi:hypothetical protein
LKALPVETSTAAFIANFSLHLATRIPSAAEIIAREAGKDKGDYRKGRKEDRKERKEIP